MKYKVKIAVFILFAVFSMALSIWGPEALARYQDRGTLNEIHTETVEEAGVGYRYKLNINEKLYILSRCLSSQTISENEQNALTYRADTGLYQDVEGSYAFIANYRSPSGEEITDEQIYETCNDALAAMKEVGILPEEVKEVMPASYDATLYSAIDVLEPRNNIAVWKLSLSNSQKNANKENRLMDAFIGAEDGKLYEFYVRTPLLWEDIDADAIIEEWSSYMGLGSPEPYESDNPLLETTPYYKKYVFPGMGEGRTIVTVGFYEGINELFLKIEK
ncbi:MAG: hypothetical protein K2H40_14750 [Lachnospiraceae bacterium]|nr:hypothetical protein [Lachnospiraceae bacterium]